MSAIAATNCLHAGHGRIGSRQYDSLRPDVGKALPAVDCAAGRSAIFEVAPFCNLTEITSVTREVTVRRDNLRLA